MDLLYIIKERHGRGNKEVARIVLPVTPRVGEWFKVVESGRLLKVRGVTTNLWDSGETLVVQIDVKYSRPYGELLLGAPTKEEKDELYTKTRPDEYSEEEPEEEPEID